MLRITGGFLKGIFIKEVKKRNVRSTQSKIREALFSILSNQVSESIFFDFYAGCGIVGIEAASRGAKKIIFVEKNKTCCRIIKDNLVKTNLTTYSKIYNLPVEKFFKKKFLKDMQTEKRKILFFDPPYYKNFYTQIFFNLNEFTKFLSFSIIVIEHSNKYKMPKSYKFFKNIKEKKYGDKLLNFFEVKK
jgi:16S rRNA (guanine(966)-N(2))-methyltransferase RsmD